MRRVTWSQLRFRTGQLPARLLVAGLTAVTVGTAVTVAAAALPARLLRRLTTASLLAEE